jgi:hypothetical protein
VVINIRNDSKKGNYSYKTQFVYSLLFNENKKVASPVTTPAPSEQVRVNFGNTTANSIPQNVEKSTPMAKKFTLSAKRGQICFLKQWHSISRSGSLIRRTISWRRVYHVQEASQAVCLSFFECFFISFLRFSHIAFYCYYCRRREEHS